MRGKRREDGSWRQWASGPEKHAAEVLDQAAGYLTPLPSDRNGPGENFGDGQSVMVGLAERLLGVRRALIGRIVARGQPVDRDKRIAELEGNDAAAAVALRGARDWLTTLVNPMAVLTETERAEVRAVFEELERMGQPAKAAMQSQDDSGLRRTT